MRTSQQKLQELLQQLFRADNADLDFGIYRIINYRRDQIQDFIDEKLPSIINDVLDENTGIESALEELKELENRVKDAFGDDVLDADGKLIDETIKTRPLVNQYLEAKENLGSPKSRDQRKDAVFNHLYTFFSRYYEDGDFIPRRRYAQTERYTIPYNGEEVHLHWANRDQYYIKSSEYFSAYKFKSGGITITFDLRSIDIEKDNVQGEKRFFLPFAAGTTYSPESEEVCIPFEYRPFTSKEQSLYGNRDQQDKIINVAEQEILAMLNDHYDALSALGYQTDGETALKKHLRNYTRRNTADFFIHKDLEQFFNRELDVYIKNEVIPLTDFILTNEISGWLETAKLVQRIASQIIEFLSQIEEFQKRLWLKKKFVLSTDYCITLGRIPEKFYTEIAHNTSQSEEWKRLFAIHQIEGDLVKSAFSEPPSVAFLKENPNLVIDTCHFDDDFKDCLLAHFDDIDNQTDGLLIHGENFQGLNLLKDRFSESLKTIYIDPPYNTDASAILYRNNYKDSSWMSLMADRLALSREFLPDDGIICVAIDDVEVSPLRFILESLFERELGIATVRSNPQGRSRTGYFSPAHEYALFYGKTEALPGCLPKTEKQKSSYPYQDEKGHFAWDNLVRRPPGDNREDVPTMYYPIYVRQDNTIRVPRMTWREAERVYDVLDTPDEDEVSILPVKSGREKRWRHGWEKVSREQRLSSSAR